MTEDRQDDLMAAKLRLAEAEARLESLNEAMRVAAQQGRFHLLDTLGTVTAGAQKTVDEARSEVDPSKP